MTRTVLLNVAYYFIDHKNMSELEWATGCFTVWLVTFASTNFCKTGQNSVLIFIVGESGTHGLLGGLLIAEEC